MSWVRLGGQWGCEHQPPGCLFSHLQEGRPRQKGGAPTHPRMVLPLASSLLRAACWAAVSRGQCCRFCSTWGSAATMLEASMSHTRTPRSSRSEALSLGWGPPCRIAGQHEPGPTAHHPASKPTAPTKQTRALCCRAVLWSGRLASNSVSPWAARRMKARQSASFTCVRLRKGWGAAGRADGGPLSDGGAPGSVLSPHGQVLGGEGHSLIEEQQVGGVELEVALEALSGSQVGQAAELGRAGSTSLAAWPGLSWALRSDWDLPGAPTHLSVLSRVHQPLLPGSPLSLDFLSASSCIHVQVRTGQGTPAPEPLPSGVGPHRGGSLRVHLPNPPLLNILSRSPQVVSNVLLILH